MSDNVSWLLFNCMKASSQSTVHLTWLGALEHASLSYLLMGLESWKHLE